MDSPATSATGFCLGSNFDMAGDGFLAGIRVLGGVLSADWILAGCEGDPETFAEPGSWPELWPELWPEGETDESGDFCGDGLLDGGGSTGAGLTGAGLAGAGLAGGD